MFEENYFEYFTKYPNMQNHANVWTNTKHYIHTRIVDYSINNLQTLDRHSRFIDFDSPMGDVRNYDPHASGH